jgi:hypothetical protein
MSAKSLSFLFAVLIAAVALATPAEAAEKKAVRHRTKHSSRVHTTDTTAASSPQNAVGKSKRGTKSTAKATAHTAKSVGNARTRTTSRAAKGTATTTQSATKSVKKRHSARPR